MSDLTDRLKARQQQNLETLKDPGQTMTERLRARQDLREQGIHEQEPIEMDIKTRQGFLASQTDRTSLGEPGTLEPSLRADLGLSDTFEEKKAKFLSKYPEGDFIQVFEPRTDPSERPQTVLFRRHPNEDFAELDARMIERFDLLGDIADLSGEVPAAVVEAFVIRGGSIVRQMGRAILGTLTGDAFKESIEEARGFQKESISQLASREVTRAVLSGAGAGATIAVTGPINSLRGAPGIALKPGAPAAIRAAKRLDMPPLLPGQIARSPFMQKMQGQAAAVVKRVGDYISAQQGAMARAMSRLREGDVKRVLNDELEAVFTEARTQILKAAQLVPNRSLTEGGTAIQQGIAEWDDLASSMVSMAYARARRIEEPKFDITSLRSVAAELKSGTPGATAGGETVNLAKIDPRLEKIIDSVLELDPSLPSVEVNGIVSTALEQLRAIRSQLWDLKTPDPGQISRKAERDASTLYGAITRILRNPTNVNKEFAEAWRQADAMASSRFTAMEQLMVIQAGKSEAPAQLASSLAKPNQVDNLRVLKNVMPDSKWSEFQQAVRADFISSEKVDGLTKRLETFDRATLDALFTKADQESLKLIGQRIDTLNSTGIKQILQRETEFGAQIDQLAMNNNTAAIKEIISLSSSRPKLRRSLRAGIMENIWNSAVTVENGTRKVSEDVIRAKIAELRKSGAIHLLEIGDLRVLKDIQAVAGFVPEAADSGTSLVAGQAVAGATEFKLSSIHTIIKHMTIGRVLTAGWFQRIALGSGKEPLPFNSLRNLGSLLGRELQAMPASEEETAGRQ